MLATTHLKFLLPASSPATGDGGDIVWSPSCSVGKVVEATLSPSGGDDGC